LLAIEDQEILDAAQLKNYLIERTTPGQRVSVKVRRVDADLTFTVILGGDRVLQRKLVRDILLHISSTGTEVSPLEE
jgi:hypothetical protein